MNEHDKPLTLGGKEVQLVPLTARRSLAAATILLPHIAALKPVLKQAMDRPAGDRKARTWGLNILLDALLLTAPLLQPDTFLDLTSQLTGLPQEELGEAPPADVLILTTRALTTIDLAGILRALMAVYGQMGSLAGAAEPGTEEGASEA